MLTEHSIVRVHLCDTKYYPNFRNEIQHRSLSHTFEVKQRDGKLGIDWNIDRIPSICKGSKFVPFEIFASNVVLEDMNTGKIYHHNHLIGSIEEIK